MLQYTYGVSTKESYAHRAGSCPPGTRPTDYKPVKHVTEKITATTTGSLTTTAETVPPNVSTCTKRIMLKKVL